MSCSLSTASKAAERSAALSLSLTAGVFTASLSIGPLKD